ncbi:MAG: hypothetical protein V1894_03470 [Chloroflexota bacterium]
MEEEERIPISFGRLHVDIIQRVVAVDEASDIETVSLEADPRRYQWVEDNGVWLLVDKFEGGVSPAEYFFEILRRVFRTPVYHEIQEVTEAEIKKKYLRIFITRPRRRE